MFSTWNAVDLHIHSSYSNNVKPNDYAGNEYNAKTLIENIHTNKDYGKIFSITDHNCINCDLYNDISNEIKNYDTVGYIIGVELDVYDKNIHDNRFHCLCFFDTYDVQKISTAVDELFNNMDLSKRTNSNSCDFSMYPDITKIFSTFHKYEFQDIILIPHFHNKACGIPANNNSVNYLNYLCFNAYEDKNNIRSIEGSLKAFLESGYDEVPYVSFSDSHDIREYPQIGKKGQKKLYKECYMLSNVDSPFSSVKNAFQEPKMRISMEGADQSFRNYKNENNYISKVRIGNNEIELSPYQNTIIGKFGSGKSLFLELIKNGSTATLKDKRYNRLPILKEDFKIYFDNQSFNSINELVTGQSHIKKYELNQIEQFYFKNYLSNDEARDLFRRLNIDIPDHKPYTFNFEEDKLTNAFNNLINLYSENDKIQNLNYEMAFEQTNYYQLSEQNCDFKDYDTYSNSLIALNDEIIHNKKLKIHDIISLFDHDEKIYMDNFTKIITKKIKLIRKLKGDTLESKIKTKIDSYKKNTNFTLAIEKKDQLKQHLDDFSTKLKELYTQCKKYEATYNENIYNKLKEEQTIPLQNTPYNISYRYDDENEEKYTPLQNKIFKSDHRKKDLFLSMLSFINDYFKNKEKTKLSNNKAYTNFSKKLESYINELKETFNEDNLKFDILINQKSMLKKSAGEKSSDFIELIFNLIESDLKKDMNIILILDQPEDNMDNKNIYEKISKNIKDLKFKYSNFQIFVVSHNANVAITADSENIIIAKEIINNDGTKNFEYNTGCIENKEYIKKVCNILEGGIDAIERRTTKYGMNIIKKVRKKYEL